MHITALDKVAGPYDLLNSLISKINLLVIPTHDAKQKYAKILHKAPLNDILDNFFKSVVQGSEAESAKKKFATTLAEIENEFSPFQGLLTIDANQLPNIANVSEAAILEINRLLNNNAPLEVDKKQLLLNKQQELLTIRSQISAAMKKLLEIDNSREFQGKGLLFYFLTRVNEAAKAAGFKHNLKGNIPLLFNPAVEERNNTSLTTIKKLIVSAENAISEALSSLDENDEQSQQTTHLFLTSLLKKGARTDQWKEQDNEKNNGLGKRLTNFYIDYIRQFGSISEKYFIVTHYYNSEMMARYAWGIATDTADYATEIGAAILAAPTIAKNYLSSGWKVYWPWSNETSIQSPDSSKEEVKIENSKDGKEVADGSNASQITINSFEDFYFQLIQFKNKFNTTHEFLSDFNLEVLQGMVKVYTHVDDYFSDKERQVLMQAAAIENKQKTYFSLLKSKSDKKTWTEQDEENLLQARPTVQELSLVTEGLNIRIARTVYRDAIKQLNDEKPESNIFNKLRTNCRTNLKFVEEINQIEASWKSSQQYAELTATVLNDLAETLNKFEEYILLIKHEFLFEDREDQQYSEQFTEKYAALYEYFKGIGAEQKKQFGQMVAATEDFIKTERVKLASAMLARLSLSKAADLESGATLTDDIVLATINKLEKFGLSRQKFIRPFTEKSPEHKTLTPESIEAFKSFTLSHGTLEQIQALRNIVENLTLKGHDVLTDSFIGSIIVLPSEEKNPEAQTIQFAAPNIIDDYKEGMPSSIQVEFKKTINDEQLNLLEVFADKHFVYNDHKLLFIETVKQSLVDKVNDEAFKQKLELSFKVCVLKLLKEKSYELFPAQDDKKLRNNYYRLAIFFANTKEISFSSIEENIKETLRLIYDNEFVYKQAKICGYTDLEARSFANDYINNCIQDLCARTSDRENYIQRPLVDVIAENKQLVINFYAHSFAKQRNISAKPLIESINSALNNFPDWSTDNKTFLSVIRTHRKLFVIRHAIIEILSEDLERIKKEKNIFTSTSKTTDKITFLTLTLEDLNNAESVEKVKAIVDSMLVEKTITQSRGIFGAFSLFDSSLKTKLTNCSEQLAKLLSGKSPRVQNSNPLIKKS